MTDWPHAPVHRLSEAGAHMVTAGTYRKEHFLSGPERLTLVRDALFACANEFGWQSAIDRRKSRHSSKSWRPLGA